MVDVQRMPSLACHYLAGSLIGRNTVRTHSYWVLSRDCLRKRNRPLYTSGGSRSDRSSFSFSDPPQLVHASGIIIDEVSECTAPFRVLRVPQDLEDHWTNATTVTTATKDLQSYIASCNELATKCISYYGSSNIRRACRHSLVGSMMSDGSGTTETGALVLASDEAVDSFFEAFEKQAVIIEEMEWFSQRMKSGTPFTDDDYARMVGSTAASQSAGSFSTKDNLLQAVAEACKGRCFFITSGNCFMGVTPDITQPGDQICVIPDCCAPFVIRPNGKHYQLIGECYGAGIMDGEVMKNRDAFIEQIVFE